MGCGIKTENISENIKINSLLKGEVEWGGNNIKTRGAWLVEKFLKDFL